MRILQHASFAIFSDQVTASDVTARLGVEPDEFMVRGSRSSDPEIPRRHMWKIRCDQPGKSVDEQIAVVMGRLTPHQEAITQLLRSIDKEGPGCGGVLRVVRYFDDEDGAEESPRSVVLEDGEELERLPGQHQLLGWHLDSDVISFLHAVGADLDVDEYG